MMIAEMKPGYDPVPQKTLRTTTTKPLPPQSTTKVVVEAGDPTLNPAYAPVPQKTLPTTTKPLPPQRITQVVVETRDQTLNPGHDAVPQKTLPITTTKPLPPQRITQVVVETRDQTLNPGHDPVPQKTLPITTTKPLPPQGTTKVVVEAQNVPIHKLSIIALNPVGYYPTCQFVPVQPRAAEVCKCDSVKVQTTNQTLVLSPQKCNKLTPLQANDSYQVCLISYYI